MKRALATLMTFVMLAIPLSGWSESSLFSRLSGERVSTSVSLTINPQAADTGISGARPDELTRSIAALINSASLNIITDENAFSITLQLQGEPVLSLIAEQQDVLLLSGSLLGGQTVGFRPQESAVVAKLLPFGAELQDVACSNSGSIVITDVVDQPFPGRFTDAQTCTTITITADLLAEMINTLLTILEEDPLGDAVLSLTAASLGTDRGMLTGCTRLAAILLPLVMQEDLVIHLYSAEDGLCAIDAEMSFEELDTFSFMTQDIGFRLLLGRLTMEGSEVWNGSLQAAASIGTLSATMYLRSADQVTGGAVTVTSIYNGVASQLLNASLSSVILSGENAESSHLQAAISVNGFPAMTLIHSSDTVATAEGAAMNCTATLSTISPQPLVALKISRASLLPVERQLDAENAIYPLDMDDDELQEWMSDTQQEVLRTIFHAMARVPAQLKNSLLMMAIRMLQ